jgi:hypothetical protein
MAQERMTDANETVEALQARRPEERHESSLTVMASAERLFQLGTHADYLRSTELSQVILDHFGYASAIAPAPMRTIAGQGTAQAGALVRTRAFALPRLRLLRDAATAMGAAFRRRVAGTWARAPLLVLLLTWLSMGLLGGPVFRLMRSDLLDSVLASTAWDLWALGFLGLVGFGFYVRVRRVRFRPPGTR